MPVVPPVLGVGTLERGVPLGLGLLDAVAVSLLASSMRRRVGSRGCVPVPVRLARLVVLRRVLGLCKIVSTSIKGMLGRYGGQRTGHCEGFGLRLKMTESEKLGCKGSTARNVACAQKWEKFGLP